VLESGHVARLGAGAETRVDFRLVSATNRDLESAVGAGRFRQDLYYRVAVIVIEVPPLRERPEDILPLAQGVLRTQGDEPKILSPAAEALLTAHTWPGNIRELRNAMLRAAILAPGDRILPDHLPPNVRAAEIRSTPAGSPSPRSLAEIEREAILAALERCGGNRSQAARDLGISRRKLLYRLKEYGGGA
jgi:DNA-binding NtrC family response regulator